MTLTIEVSGELEAAIRAQAREQGLTEGSVAQRVLARALTPGLDPVGTHPSTTARGGDEKARAFVDWARGHRDTPPLSDEEVSRASMYPDRS